MKIAIFGIIVNSISSTLSFIFSLVVTSFLQKFFIFLHRVEELSKQFARIMVVEFKNSVAIYRLAGCCSGFFHCVSSFPTKEIHTQSRGSWRSMAGLPCGSLLEWRFTMVLVG